MTSTEWVHVSLVWPSEQLVVCVWMVVRLYFHVFGWQLNISIAKWNVPVPFLQDGNVVDITLSHIHRIPHRICNILTNANNVNRLFTIQSKQINPTPVWPWEIIVLRKED